MKFCSLLQLFETLLCTQKLFIFLYWDIEAKLLTCLKVIKSLPIIVSDLVKGLLLTTQKQFLLVLFSLLFYVCLCWWFRKNQISFLHCWNFQLLSPLSIIECVTVLVLPWKWWFNLLSVNVTMDNLSCKSVKLLSRKENDKFGNFFVLFGQDREKHLFCSCLSNQQWWDCEDYANNF